VDQLSVEGVKVSEDEEREVLESKFEEKHAEKDNSDKNLHFFEIFF